MPTEKVIELSVEETNRLREQLGLAPLRNAGSTNTNGGSESFKKEFVAADSNEQVLEISVEETNDLRQKLGLKPLRTNEETSRQNNIEHVPAENEAEKKAALERIENAKLKRQVEHNIRTKFAGNSLTESLDNAESWAKKMLVEKPKQQIKKSSSNTKQQKEKVNFNEYDESDLHGMNVAHSMHELEEGSTTILTLADTHILNTREDTSQKIIGLNEDEEIDLENVNLAEQRSREKGLREKRKLEMGLGRAGGYAGYDDDEFEELGGVQAPSRFKSTLLGNKAEKPKKNRYGFTIGSDYDDGNGQESDLFASIDSGKAISLEASHIDAPASDFMTVEEDRILREQKKSKKEDKKEKFHKRKKKDKKKKSKHRSTTESDEEDEEQEVDDREVELPTTKGLLEELEASAVGKATEAGKRKRNDSNDEGRNSMTVSGKEISEKITKRTKFDEAMAKANERSKISFEQNKMEQHPSVAVDYDDEPDDAFLNEALAKARRISRLKEISRSSQNIVKKGADAVIDAVQAVKNEQTTTMNVEGQQGTIEFSIDETLEFTRALKAKTELKVKEDSVASKYASLNKSTEKESLGEIPMDVSAMVNGNSKIDDEEEEMDIEELAKNLKDDDNYDDDDDVALDGTTGTTVALGRGVGNMLSLLMQSGEMTRKNAGKEEMRGRAKDKRTYEDYEPLDLSKVVKINERNAHSKDIELANREIKLDYRDEHGRLLTRKEAFRQLSYQFHGYGSGKRKEEKKLKQIQQEQAQIRLASRQNTEGGAAGTFGALKATQKATGKAFVVHKTS